MSAPKFPPPNPGGPVKDPEGPTRRISLWHILFAVWAGMILFQFVLRSTIPSTKVSYTEFKELVRQDKVAEVKMGPSLITGTLKPGEKLPERPPPSEVAPPVKVGPGATAGAEDQPEKEAPAAAIFETVRLDDEDLLRDLEAHHVEVTGIAESTFFADWLPTIVLVGLFVLIWAFGLRRMREAQGGFMTVGKSKAKVVMEKDIKISFKDVAGVDEAKEELTEVVEFLKVPEKFARLGGKIPKGVLLVGPPGTGKTLLAKAVAGEAAVPFFYISGSDFVEMFVGVGAARVRDLFVQAKSKAPCIIFIDELDALGKARGIGPVAHEEREQTLNQLLVELDGFDSRVGVILMAATNRPEILDPALLRAGRFDRTVLVDRPDKIGRLEILKIHAREVPLEGGDKALEDTAAMTAGFAGADLANIVNEAALLAVRRGKDTVGKPELQEAVERVIAGLEKKNRTLTRSEKERVAHHEVGHALCALSLPGSEVVHKISIIPRGIAALGYTMQVPTEDRFLMTRAELENKIAVLLGGRVAEELIFQEISTGARDDLVKATDIARSMVRAYGMSDRLGQVSLDRDSRSPFLAAGQQGGSSNEYSEQTAREIDSEVRRIIDEQYHRTRGILSRQLEAVRACAKVLLEKETISGEELAAVVQGVQKDSAPTEGNGASERGAEAAGRES